jgi:hypothetical protein
VATAVKDADLVATETRHWFPQAYLGRAGPTWWGYCTAPGSPDFPALRPSHSMFGPSVRPKTTEPQLGTRTHCRTKRLHAPEPIRPIGCKALNLSRIARVGNIQITKSPLIRPGCSARTAERRWRHPSPQPHAKIDPKTSDPARSGPGRYSINAGAWSCPSCDKAVPRLRQTSTVGWRMATVWACCPNAAYTSFHSAHRPRDFIPVR